MAEKFTMSLPDTMYEEIEKRREKRKFDSIQETIRAILSEYLKEKNEKD